jgi:hypothetical protein
VWNLGEQPAAARCPSPQRRHVRSAPGLVDEDQTPAVDPILILHPPAPPPRWHFSGASFRWKDRAVVNRALRIPKPGCGSRPCGFHPFCNPIREVKPPYGPVGCPVPGEKRTCFDYPAKSQFDPDRTSRMSVPAKPVAKSGLPTEICCSASGICDDCIALGNDLSVIKKLGYISKRPRHAAANKWGRTQWHHQCRSPLCWARQSRSFR